MFREKYHILPSLSDSFDIIYQNILLFCEKHHKPIVIDSAQFHCIKNINLLKGTIIIMRTFIDNCYSRCLERYQQLNPNYTEEEFKAYQEKKKNIYKWYKYTNKFIEEINKL